MSVDELSRHVQTLYAREWTEKGAAHQSIARYSGHDPRAAYVLVRGLAVPEWDDRRFVMAALRRLGATALPPLFEATAADEATIRQRAVITLGGMPEHRDDIAPVLTKWLAKANDTQSKRLAILALGDLRVQSDEAVQLFVRATDDPDRAVRLAGLHALSKLEGPSELVISGVRRRLTADDLPTRHAAAQGIRRLAPQLAEELLGPAYDSTAAHLAGLAGRDVGQYDSPQWGGAWTRTNAPFAENLPSVWSWSGIAGDWQNENLSDAEWAKISREGTRNIKWIARLGSQTYVNPVVANGRIYIGTNNMAGYVRRYPPEVDLGCLLCFDEPTGKFLWQLSRPKLPEGRVHDWPYQGICASAVVDGDRLWIVTNRCELMCLDTQGFTDGENDGPFQGEENENPDEADIVWVLDMIKELDVSPHNMSSCSPVLVDGRLFVCTSNGVDETHRFLPRPKAPSFIAVDSRTGNVLWTDNSPGHNIMHAQWASPAYGTFGGQPQVIFPGGDGWVYSFGPAGDGQEGSKLLWKFDGNPKWSKYSISDRSRRNSIIAFPVIYDGLVYISMGEDPEHGEGEGMLWCIDPARETNGGDISAELVMDKAGNVMPPQRFEYESPITLSWIPPDGGERAAWTEMTAEITPRFVPNPNSGVVWWYDKFDRDGDGKYDFEEAFHRSLSAPAIKDDILYAVDFSGLVTCLNAKTGAVYWTYDLLSQCWSSPVVVDGKVYIADEDGEITVFRHSSDPLVAMVDGEPLAVNQMDSAVYTTPVVANGMLFIATQRLLYAIEEHSR